MWERKRIAKENPHNVESSITIETMSTNTVNTDTTIKLRLNKTNQIAVEQTKDGTLVQLKAKLQKEAYSEEALLRDIRYKHYLRNADRIVLRDEVLTRQYFGETGQIKYLQILLPQHLVSTLLESLHGQAHRHPGIAKMLQEIRQKYYYPGIAKLVKRWVQGCETCAKEKRTPNTTITPELLNLPEWDLGPEDAMQIDLLPNLPPSGGYNCIITAIDVFSRYLFAYPLIEATATSTAKVLIDIMTKHSYLPTTLLTDKSSVFTSIIIEEITKILGITLKCATTKHPQTIGKLERTHASLKTNLKMASGEYRRQWHKYLPLAVLNYNTSYHTSIGCEPTRVFHGRIPFNILDHKLGLNPNEKILPTTDFAEELQRKTQILIDQTKHNVMQSYLKYKEYYDRKARAAPLQEKDYCFALQPKADNQGSKIPFRDYRWVGPYIVQKALPNDNYIIPKINTNKTQILHRIRLKKFIPNKPITDSYQNEQLQQDNDITIPQDDLYALTWETDFGNTISEQSGHMSNTMSDRLQRHNAEAANESTVTRIRIDSEPNNNDVNDSSSTSNATNTNDVMQNINDASDNSRVPDLSEQRQNHESIPNTNANKYSDKSNTNGSVSDLSKQPDRNEKDINENETRNEPQTTDNLGNNFSTGGDITVPGISEGDQNKVMNESTSPRGGKYNLRPNPTPSYTDEYRY